MSMPQAGGDFSIDTFVDQILAIEVPNHKQCILAALCAKPSMQTGLTKFSANGLDTTQMQTDMTTKL